MQSPFMPARVITGASLTIPIQGRRLDETGIDSDPRLSRLALTAIKGLVTAIEASGPGTGIQ